MCASVQTGSKIIVKGFVIRLEEVYQKYKANMTVLLFHHFIPEDIKTYIYTVRMKKKFKHLLNSSSNSDVCKLN